MKKITALLAASGFALTLAACDVDQTEEGNLPEYDVEGPDIDVDTGTTDVEIPDSIEVPTLDVDVDGPGDAEGEPVTGETE